MCMSHLQSLHAVEAHVMTNFLPTILNQLFCVLTSAAHEDVAVNVTRSVLTCLSKALSILVHFSIASILLQSFSAPKTEHFGRFLSF